jgi:hypothetical protein
MSVKIFISHKKEDSDKAEYVAKYIKQNYKLDVYVDTLDDNINSTTNITDRIVNKLKGSTHLLVVFSEHTTKSMWVPFELGVSYEREQGIGVLIWPDKRIKDDLPEYLDEFPKLNCYPQYNNGNCINSDLDKYLNEVKKYSSTKPSFESLDESTFTHRTTASAKTNYAREFIDSLNSKL